MLVGARSRPHRPAPILLASQLFQMAMAVTLACSTSRTGSGWRRSWDRPVHGPDAVAVGADYQAVITSLVPREKIANAVALNSLQFNLSRAIGP